ncbi:hypothetical protein FIV42_15605 [Persicimonas caeni]|uniref:Wadjet protein JetD C-terminal domain-containing protein n=1 Tax=Persicimonas caeni TaxID=2292766 RepID=A0A4Y6PVU4_PERCE|nr:hypothetical protein [Persicimonas caeni]QDG52117.1 hypothetical protein FIV42_15605 [Persicimonas caeni]QED33338.1 hypothetical protein FRD00_15600 [Persicimonas caeni]
MSVDALADRLARLLDEGSCPASALSRAMRRRLQPLFNLGVLVERRAGAGFRVQLTSPEALLRWIAREYPYGLDGTDKELPSRARGMANFADSKRGRGVDASLLQLRGFGDAVLRHADGDMPVAELTRRFGVASLVLEEPFEWAFSGRLTIVENLEFFLSVEHLITDVEVALWSRGRTSSRVLNWLASPPMAQATVIHAGDYDPVGLDEYLKLADALSLVGESTRVELFVPDDFVERLQRFGRAELLSDSAEVLERVRSQADDAVRGVLAEIDRIGKGLEQEGLLISLDGA